MLMTVIEPLMDFQYDIFFQEEEMEECHEQNSRSSPWSPFGQSNGPQSLQKTQGLQVSQLSHLLQQNGSSTMVSCLSVWFFETSVSSESQVFH